MNVQKFIKVVQKKILFIKNGIYLYLKDTMMMFGKGKKIFRTTKKGIIQLLKEVWKINGIQY